MMKNVLTFTLSFFICLSIWQTSLAQPVSFNKQTLGSAFIPREVDHADLNNDGHIDIISAEATTGKMHWWKNDGASNPSFTKIQFDNDFVQAQNFITVDLNGDGRIDIINGSYTLDQVAVWLNNGEPGTPTFTKQVIKNFNGPLDLAAGDMDNDGDIDVAVLGQAATANKLIVLWNDGNLMPSFTTTELGVSPVRANKRGLVVADLNKDGKRDIMVNHDVFVQVKFFRNLGGQQFQDRTISTGFFTENYVAADMNGDSHMDVLMTIRDNGSTTSNIGYFENSGLYNPNNTNPNFSKEKEGVTPNGSYVYPADLDDDGNMDILYSFAFGDGFEWAHNSGGANPSFTQYVIDANPGEAYTFKAADLDGDGDLDPYGAEFQKIVWFENDLLAPLELTCPGDVTVNTDQGVCNAYVSNLTATSTGGCGNTTIINSENGTGDASGTFDKGNTTVIFTAIDACGNTDNCTTTITVNDNQGPNLVCRSGNISLRYDGTFTFGASDVTSVSVDNMPPAPQCKTGTVYLNGDGVYMLEEDDVFDGGTDNCGTVNYISSSPSSLTCADDGNTVSVTVTADDGNGNTATCTATITVEESGDMSSGWAVYDLGQVTMGNDYYYAACDALPTYAVTGSGNNSMNPTSDNVAFAGYQLCGDGSIIAKIESITPNGYGGLMIREDGSPGSKQVSLFSNMSSMLLHEYRNSTNGYKITGTFFKPNSVWLKLDRQGDWVFAYNSFDGNIFHYVHAVYVPMQSCVEFGMASYTWLPWGQTEAVFSNVSITGGNGGMAIEGPAPETKPTKPSSTSLNLSLFPNPNNGNFTVQLDEVFEQDVQLVLYNQYGQVVEQKVVAPQTRYVEWNMFDVQTGTYFMHLIGEGVAPQIKAITVAR